MEQIDRYELRIQESDIDFENFYMYAYEPDFAVYFNNNNTGCTINLPGYREVDFDLDVLEIIKKEDDYKYVGVISLYTEGDYMGIHLELDEPLRKYPSNSVENGNILVLYGNSLGDFNKFTRRLFNYINFGFKEFEVYDHKVDDFIDGEIYDFNSIESTKQYLMKTYGFKTENINLY